MKKRLNMRSQINDPALHSCAALLWVSLLIVFGSITTAKAQSCPSSLNGFQLLRSTYAGWTINNLSCKPATEGGTMCWIVCAYSNPNSRDGFYTQAMWYTQPSPNGPYYPEMCQADPPTNTLSSTSKQIKAFWGDTGSDFELAAARQVTQQLFALGETQAVACPPPPTVRVVQPGPMRPECTPKGNPPLPRGRVKSPVGKVEMYSYALDKWKGPITSEFPLFPCDRVRTGDQSSASVFIYLPSGLEDRIDMSGDTILEIPGLLPAEMPSRPDESEGFTTSLIKGTIRWLTPESEGERMRREQDENPARGIFNVRTPTAAVGTRGTDFVLTRSG